MAVHSPLDDSRSCADTLLLSKGSLLNTPLVSVKTRRPVFITHTRFASTTIYRVEDTFSLRPIASILWTGFGNSNEEPCIALPSNENRSETVMTPIDVWLTKPKGLFGKSDSRKFASFKEPSVLLKWSPECNLTGFKSSHLHFKVWSCKLCNSSSASSRSDQLCTFIPPAENVLRSELILTGVGQEFLEELVLSCIVLGSKEDEWKSSHSEDELPILFVSNPSRRRHQNRTRNGSSRPQTAPVAPRESIRPHTEDHHVRRAFTFQGPSAPSYGSWMADSDRMPPPAYASTTDVRIPSAVS